MADTQHYKDRITTLEKQVQQLMEVVELNRTNASGANKTMTLQGGANNFKAQTHRAALTDC